jgi:hypothetical protein
VVAGRCLYGATVDGMGGDGDDEVSAEALPLQCLLLAISGCDSAETSMRLSDDLVGRGMPSWIRTSSQWLVLLANLFKYHTGVAGGAPDAGGGAADDAAGAAGGG